MTTAPSAELSAALTGRYVLERELGGGGMSRVFLAREIALGRTVVLKVLPDDMASGVSAERFAREIQLAASLSQANIVPLLAAGDAGGVPFYTMPFVAGDSLRDRMTRGPVPAAEAVGILRDIARALAYAHERGVGIGTSSRRTCCCRTARQSSPISVSRKRSPRRVPTLKARGVALAALGRRDEAMAVARRLEHSIRPVQPQDACSLAWPVCRTEARAEILATLGQRAEAAALLEDRMYRMLVNWFADWGLLGERLRGEPSFEAFVRTRG